MFDIHEGAVIEANSSESQNSASVGVRGLQIGWRLEPSRLQSTSHHRTFRLCRRAGRAAAA